VILPSPPILGNLQAQVLTKILKFTSIPVRGNRCMQLVMFNLKMEI